MCLCQLLNILWRCDFCFEAVEIFRVLNVDKMDLFMVDWWQEEIHELLLSFAEAGATVVRLKGGDPLVSYCLGLF